MPATWFLKTRRSPLLAARFAWLLAWILLAAAGSANAAPTVLIVGDSISAGYGLAAGQGWVDLLQRKLSAQGLPHKVVNASISGDTTAGGRSRIAAALQTHRPQIVIIELGGNDGLRGSALTPVKANLDYMVEAAQKAGAKVLLLGMQLPPNYGSKYVAEFSSLFGDVAKSRQTGLVPFLLQAFGNKPELFQSDRIHPTAQAQPLMLDAIWPELKKLLPAR
ncbi:MAG: arylesterase [Betaproteobacteria bacterium]